MLYCLNHKKFVGKIWLLIFLAWEFYSSETDSQLTQPQGLPFFPLSKYFFSFICIFLFLASGGWRQAEWFSLIILVTQSACNSIWRACSSEEVGGGEEGGREVTGSLLSKYERGRRRRSSSPWAGYNRKSLSPPTPPPPHKNALSESKVNKPMRPLRISTHGPFIVHEFPYFPHGRTRRSRFDVVGSVITFSNDKRRGPQYLLYVFVEYGSF